MKDEKSIYKLKKTLTERVLQAPMDILHQLHQKCVKDKKFNYTEILAVTSGNTPLDNLSEQQLYWLLEYANKLIKGLGKSEDYFTEFEIQNYKYYETETAKSVEYPIIFKNAVALMPKAGADCRQYSFHLSVEDISKYKSNMIFQVIPELQRGGRRDKYNELTTKVNPVRRKEITDLIERGEYFYNSISLSLVDDEEADWYYDDKEGQLIIKKGNLIIPDGNHRAVACEFVDKTNIHAQDIFHVLFTFSTPKEIKKKIAQEWNTEPVSKIHQRYMQASVANQIVDAIKRSPDVDDMIRNNIVTTGMQAQNGEGFIIYSIMADAIEKYYNTKTMSTKHEQNAAAAWLVEFLNYLIYIYKDDFSKFRNLRNIKWNVNPYAFVGYIYLSKHLRESGQWKTELKDILKKIDFTKMEEFRKTKAEKAYVRYVENKFIEGAENAKTEKRNEKGNV